MTVMIGGWGESGSPRALIAGVLRARAVPGSVPTDGETRVIGGEPCVLETAWRADVALIGATVADLAGKLTWRDGERNMNDPMTYAADLVMVPVLVVDRIVVA